MRTTTPTRRTGERRAPAGVVAATLLALVGAAVAPRAAHASADQPFTVTVDRSEIGQDESVSLKFAFEAEGAVRTTPPTYSAPDFEEINEYSGSFMESFYDSTQGQFKVKNNQTLTKVLRPTRQGNLRISGLRMTAGGKVYTAPDIFVRVTAPGAGSPPPRGFGGGGGPGNGLRGSARRSNAPLTIVRAEVDKSRVVKGEQIIVSYYLYTRAKTFNISVDKFPVLKGFLREDLEMPILSHLDMETVTLDGVPYRRALLARYAAYPLEEGELKIDSMALKYNYYAPQGGGMDDGEDPFLNFFQQLSPRMGQSRSDQISVQVAALPTDGKPACFTGGVGDFNVVSAVDKYEVRANEAVTLTVKVEGRGNVAAIGEPKAKWPDSVELYDAKASAKAAPGGVGQKLFEFLLIPRTPGQVQLPALDLCYFDPAKKAYLTRHTDPISLRVLDPAPGSTPPPPASPGAGTPGGVTPRRTDTPAPSLQDLKLPGGATVSAGFPLWTWIARVAIGAMLLMLAWMGWDLLRRRLTRWRSRAAAGRQRGERKLRDRWEALRARASKAGAPGAPWNEISESYEELIGLILDTLDERYRVGAHGRPRSELRELLVDERGMPESSWNAAVRVLEYAETVRYAGEQGGVPATEARAGLAGWVRDAEAWANALASTPR